MPRTFTEHERVRIRERLLADGRRAFSTYGLHRTSVEELARAARISKGAFYQFFESKEDLLLELLEQFEVEFRQQLLAAVLRPELTPRESLRQLLRLSLAARHQEPLLRHLADADFEVQMRRVPEARARALREADVVASRAFLDYWRQRGARIIIDPELLTGMLRAIILAAFREAEIGPDVSDRVFELLIDAVANHLMPSTIEEAAHAR